MKTHLECLPCFLEQAIRSARLATSDKILIDKTVCEAASLLSKIDLKNSPPQTGALIDRLAKELTGNIDPFMAIKKESTRHALAIYPQLKEMVMEAADPLLVAIKVAIAGNVIDLGVSHRFTLEKELANILQVPLAINHYAEFKKNLRETNHILYLGDNAGETVLDRILIEQMQKPTTFVVRENPVINDATIEDARQAGLEQVATIISSGSPAPATILTLCSQEFQKTFREATFIISKGQGNFEALSDEESPIFYLFKAKCDVVANYLNVKLGDNILKANQLFLGNGD